MWGYEKVRGAIPLVGTAVVSFRGRCPAKPKSLPSDSHAENTLVQSVNKHPPLNHSASLISEPTHIITTKQAKPTFQPIN